MLSPNKIAQYALTIGLQKINKKPVITLVSAFMAGIFVSLGFIFYILIISNHEAALASNLYRFLGGITFSLGIMLIIVSGADLFTSAILTILPKLTKQISYKQMFTNWTLVYIGNFFGAIFIIGVIWFSNQNMAFNGQFSVNVLNISVKKLHYSFIEAICLGFLANLMVCLAVWLSYAGKSLLDKTIIMILPVAMFVSNGFEHSIANLFMLPLGLLVKNYSSNEFWQKVGLSPESFSELTTQNFVMNNLIPVTIGNILGGLLIGLVYWFMHLRENEAKH